MRILVTGGAGFVGSAICFELRERIAEAEVIAFDNLHRKGSELNVPRLEIGGVKFVHGDVRERDQLMALDRIDGLVECSAEPSALAGFDGSPDYVVETNLTGAYNCLELARRDDAAFVFLSTSRVYPIEALNSIVLEEHETRFEISVDQSLPGVSDRGITEQFPLTGPRTLYGATKLAAELLIGEYAYAYGLQTVINRFGVITGPWQMGKVDQGIFMYMMLCHRFGIPFEYIGFGGTGKQVRDLLHVGEAASLIGLQLNDIGHYAGMTFNVGGGREYSLSLAETTELCGELLGRTAPITPNPETRRGDVPLYVTDNTLVMEYSGWRPTTAPVRVLSELQTFVEQNAATIAPALGIKIP